MKREDELVLKVAKEIAVKFIETGRLSITNFDEAFKQVHRTVKESLEENAFGGVSED